MTRAELPKESHYEFLCRYFDHLPDKDVFLIPVTKQGAPIYMFAYYDGFNVLGVCRTILQRDGLLISYLAVDERHRGRGVGRQLVMAVMTFTRDTLVKRVMANTRHHNLKMIDLLAKLEFKQSISPENYKNGDLKLHHIYEANSSG